MKPPPLSRVNLASATILLIDPNAQALTVLAQAIMGFGVQSIVRAGSSEEAKEAVTVRPFDLILCESGADQHGVDGFDFVHWLRRSGNPMNTFAPVVLTSAHASERNVAKARDCGANFIIAKPIVPGVLLERILWVARDERQYVECETYVGPDRRFKNVGPPADTEGRRSTDLSARVGRASEPNMSQDEIDNLMQPMRAVL